MQISDQIRILRQQHGMSQEALAEELHVSRQAVSKWEQGISFPTTENLLTLSQLFHVPVERLTQPVNAAEEPPSTEEILPDPKPAPRSPRRWPLLLLAALLILGLAGGYLHGRGQEHDSTDERPSVSETGEFALLWQQDSAWQTISLGKQAELFPFGLPLVPSAREEVFPTDFGDDWVIHVVQCGNLHLSYSRFQEEGAPYDAVDVLSTITAEYETPRGIRVGSPVSEVLEQYNTGELTYQLRESGSGILCRHEYAYVYAPEEAAGTAVLYYINLGSVAGISVVGPTEVGNGAFAVDHQTIFPLLENGQPDFSQRQEPEREELDATRVVYVALSALQNDQNLSEEDAYLHRQTIYQNLQFLDWQAYGLLGEAGRELETQGQLLYWLQKNRAQSQEQIMGLLLGACRSHLDGRLTDAYVTVLFSTFLQYPERFLRTLSDDRLSGEEQTRVADLVLRGGTVDEITTAELREALQDLARTGGWTQREEENLERLTEGVKQQ